MVRGLRKVAAVRTLIHRVVPEAVGYTRSSVVRDATAGLTVAVVALPLALAFGVSSGLGASAGMTSAIIAGFLAAMLGGSRFQVSGPTGAMTVVLIPIAHRLGEQGVLAVGMLAGALIVGAGLLRLGRLVRRLPTSLIEGFTGGIAVVIALQQVPLALQSPASPHENVVLRARDAVSAFNAKPHWAGLAVAAAVFAAVMLAGERWHGKPVALVAVVTASGVVEALHLPVVLIGELPASIGTFSLDFVGAYPLTTLIAPALGVALLAILESLLSATVADRMRADSVHHQPNRELVGQGVANLVVPLFGGVPATAALARTAVNVRSGAESRFAAMLHAAVLAVTVLAAAHLVAFIPIAALAGVLVATTARMIKPREMMAMARRDRIDAAVLTTTFVLTIVVDLITAVAAGVVVTILLQRVRVLRSVPPVDLDETLGD